MDYLIGDLQGCCDPLDQLLGKLGRDNPTLHQALRDTGLPLEVTLVRGTEERTVTVQAPTTEASEPPAGSSRPN